MWRKDSFNLKDEFENWIGKEKIDFDKAKKEGRYWTQETKAYFGEKFDNGVIVPYELERVSEKEDLRIPKETSRHWISSSIEKRAKRRGEVIKEFLKEKDLYNKELEGKSDVELEDYLFIDRPSFRKNNRLINSFEYLLERNIIFPYNLKRKDAYLIGYCDGSGHTAEDSITSQIFGRKKEMKRISEKLGFNTEPKLKLKKEEFEIDGKKSRSHKNTYGLTIPYPITRLNIAAGVRRGSKSKNKIEVPKWAKEKNGLGKEYLAGRIDSQSSVSKEKGISLCINVYPEYKETHKKYLEDLGNLTSAKCGEVREYEKGGNYELRLNFSSKLGEIKKFLEEVPLRNIEKREVLLNGLTKR